MVIARSAEQNAAAALLPAGAPEEAPDDEE